MPHYQKMGKIPKKRHTQFRKQDGSLYTEELFSTRGFADICSRAYHIHDPTAIIKMGNKHDLRPKTAGKYFLKPQSFDGFKIDSNSDFLKSRKPLLINNDCQIIVAAPTESMKEDNFYKNGSADEMIFVHKGNGTLHSMFGALAFKEGDYIVIPRGITYQIHFATKENRLLIVESAGAIEFPAKYLSKTGQFLEHSPYCEQDIHPPYELFPHDESGEFLIKIKQEGILQEIYYKYHPFDVVGWNGCCYPFTFSIHDFEPVTGRVHQPPPVHQTFAGHKFVVCSFCPRLLDYHPQAIPAPYAHNNVDGPEVIYYVDGDFTSRKNITHGTLTLHPSGIPHGPHPGMTEGSIGKEKTDELAVMVDTFNPLKPTIDALDIENKNYYLSWIHS